jgi:hypothetical protein
MLKELGKKDQDDTQRVIQKEYHLEKKDIEGKADDNN